MTKIQLRRDTSSNWTSEDPVLLAGEMGFETNTSKFKFGDGSTAWSSLPYYQSADAVHAISDGAAFEIDPKWGNIQTLTLGASRTPKATNFMSGQSMTLHVAATSYTITWTDGTLSPTWIGGAAPTLSATDDTVISLWKVGSTIYGALVGYA